MNSALLSRCRVFTLRALTEEEVGALLDRAVAAEEGLAGTRVARAGRARGARALADGDARRALNALEVGAAAVRLAGRTELTRADAEDALQQRTLLYDKAGEQHYDVVSAFIKSLRGSDPDAALYYMVRMLEAGEDPRFVLRRMVIFASEDVGNADPQALQVAVAAQQAVEFVGLPEGVLPMSQAAIYLALAPKSNSVIAAYGDARRLVQERGALAGAAEAPQRADGAHEGAGLRRRLPLPAQLRGALRRRGVPPGRAPRRGGREALGERAREGARGALAGDQGEAREVTS